MAVLIASVPHCGTFFTAHIFEQAGFVLKAEWEPILPNTVAVWHFNESERKINTFLEEHTVVIPVRQFDKVKATWDRNRMNLGYLLRDWATMESERFSGCFRLHIDDPNIREIELQRISEHIGVQLATDWAPMNSLLHK